MPKDRKGRVQGNGGARSQDTLVINAAECEAGVGEAGEAVPVQPGPQGDVLWQRWERRKTKRKGNKYVCFHAY